MCDTQAMLSLGTRDKQDVVLGQLLECIVHTNPIRRQTSESLSQPLEVLEGLWHAPKSGCGSRQVGQENGKSYNDV